MDRQSQIKRLAEYGDDLSRITTDVHELQAVIDRLRTDGNELAQMAAEREMQLGQQATSLARLEQERAHWQQRAEAATTALRMAEGGLADHDRDVAIREDELRILRLRVAEQERLLRDAEKERMDHQDDLVGRTTRSNARTDDGHILMITSATGYDLGFSGDPCPSVGDRVQIEGRWFTVEGTGRSPLPGDARPCALVTPERS